MKHNRVVLLNALMYLVAIVAFYGCGDTVPVWVGEVKLHDYTLYRADIPCQFEASVPNNATPLALELEITYYAKLGRNDLPLFIVLENKATKEVTEYKTSVPLIINGQPLGLLEENGVDYTLSHIAVPALRLPAGSYILKIYADDPSVDKIMGIVKITSRMFEQQPK